MQRPAQGSTHSTLSPHQHRRGFQQQITGLAQCLTLGDAVGKSSPQQPLAGRWEGLEHIFKTGLNRLPQARHGGHGDGLHPRQVLFELLDRRVGLGAGAGQEVITGTALVGMPDRQHAEHRRAGSRVGHAGQGTHLVQQVGVGQRNPFGLTGGAGGVEHRGQLMTAMAGRQGWLTQR